MSDLLLQIVIDKLASPLLQKLNDLCSLKENIGKLRQSLPLVLAFLEDAEKRQETEKTIEVWLLELKNVAYESEDLLDELTAEIMLCENHSRISDKVRNLLPFEPSRHLFDLAKELRNKLKELRKIVKRGFRLNFKEGAVFKWSETLGRRTETGSFVKESDIYGREDDRKKIMELLLPTGKAKTLEDVSVIPIVGIGGLGKTTLARLVYNDEKVIQCFDLKIWVYVSQDFDVRKLIIAIINSITRRNCEFSEIDLLQSQIQESLCGMRFLLVLDDVWNEDKKEWDKLGDILKSGVKGSKIIVTTRSTEVASIMGTTNSTYHLKGLLEDDCWALFKKQVFGYGEEDKYPNLLAIGKKIIKKCGGVALAATTLGSQLRSKREEKDWLLVQESEFWNLKQCQSDILPALRLSYIHLPLHLKRCFAFCSLFPKNYEFKKEKLIYIWMAEGLIQPLEGNRPLEDIADEYFNDLLCSSFFQEVEKCEDGNITSYKMHDLIHDLARSIGGNEFVILEDGLDPSNLARTRHSSVVGNFDSFPLDLIKVKHLRTLLCYLGGDSEELPSFLPASFIYLRVFDLSGCGIKKLPESISVLMCLRYLDLSNTPIQTLPHTICNLYNLQTLNLSGCSNLEELPLGMGNLTSLRHLIITGCEGLTRLPAGIGKLVHLQTLPIYIVGKGRGESIAELNSLNLRGELSIKCLENVTDAKEAQKANLREKKHLNMLRLIWGDNNDQGHNLKAAKGSTSQGLKYGKNNGSPGSSRSNSFWDSGIEAKDILECLEPHPNLRKLFIKGYPGIKFPGWVLPNLVQVVLINFRRCENLPTLGQLPFLKTISLQGMDGVVCIAEEFYGSDSQTLFPSLKELKLRDFPNLEQWSSIDDRESFPCLDKLIVDGCPNLRKMPVFPSLQRLELRNCHPKIMNSIKDVTSLSILVIDSFPKLLHLPGELLENNMRLTSFEVRKCQNLRSLPSELGSLSALKSLIISHCENLAHLSPSLQNLKALEFLEINDCHGMKTLREDVIGGLSSLRTLVIENCNNLISLSNGLRFLTALERLSIMSCPKLAFLPNGLQNLSTLQSLSILSCPELFSLPQELQHVTTLQSLVIHSCPGLTILPDWVGNFSSLRSLSISNCHYLTSLPAGLQHLSKLQHLSIQDCPLLERLCKQKKGKNWRNIAHIPHIYVGSMKLGK
ncbi:hypothetical protein ACSBR1_019424 [Camellia fascicularis]